MLSDEFSEWIAYDNVDPFGHDRIDYNHAITAMTIANCHRQKGQKVFKPKDFIPEFGEPTTKRQSAQEMQALMFSMAKAHNKKLEAGKKDK